MQVRPLLRPAGKRDVRRLRASGTRAAVHLMIAGLNAHHRQPCQSMFEISCRIGKLALKLFKFDRATKGRSLLVLVGHGFLPDFPSVCGIRDFKEPWCAAAVPAFPTCSYHAFLSKKRRQTLCKGDIAFAAPKRPVFLKSAWPKTEPDIFGCLLPFDLFWLLRCKQQIGKSEAGGSWTPFSFERPRTDSLVHFAFQNLCQERPSASLHLQRPTHLC